MSEQYYGKNEYWTPKTRPLTIKIEELTENKIKFVADGQTHTLFNALRSALLEDEDVKFVAYRLSHPLKEEVIFVLETKKGNPIEAIKRALQKLRDKMNELKRDLLKAVDQDVRAPYFIQEEEWKKYVEENL
ncbi:MAG: DNA-directed RNA polymerase subunit L [Candidatus Njordarchaeia archaeon]